MRPEDPLESARRNHPGVPRHKTSSSSSETSAGPVRKNHVATTAGETRRLPPVVPPIEGRFSAAKHSVAAKKIEAETPDIRNAISTTPRLSPRVAGVTGCGELPVLGEEVGHQCKPEGRALRDATRLASSEDAAARWVGKDALRDLTDPKVRARVARS